MLNLSTKGRYGLRAMCELALHEANVPMSLSLIAEKQNISVRYLEQLFNQLKKAGLVTSVRGVNGGYFLSKTPEQITVSEIVTVLDGDVSPVACVSGCTECETPDNCMTKPLWKQLHDKVYEIMDNTTLLDLIESENK